MGTGGFLFKQQGQSWACSCMWWGKDVSELPWDKSRGMRYVGRALDHNEETYGPKQIMSPWYLSFFICGMGIIQPVLPSCRDVARFIRDYTRESVSGIG